MILKIKGLLFCGMLFVQASAQGEMRVHRGIAPDPVIIIVPTRAPPERTFFCLDSGKDKELKLTGWAVFESRLGKDGERQVMFLGPLHESECQAQAQKLNAAYTR